MATIDGNKKKLTVSGEAIESAVNSKHEHRNSSVLDKLSDNNGTLQYNGADITTEYTLPTASKTVLGGVKVDGSTITITDGVIKSKQATIDSALNSTSTNAIQNKAVNAALLNKQDKLTAGNNVTIENNTISATKYTLPTASKTVLGGVKVDGSTITINGNGIISATSTGTGITEEQAANVAKIPTIETNVNANKTSITELTNRITEVESSGVSDEAVKTKVQEMAQAGQIQAYTIGDKSINASAKIEDGTITQELFDESVKFGISDNEVTLEKLNPEDFGNVYTVDADAQLVFTCFYLDTTKIPAAEEYIYDVSLELSYASDTQGIVRSIGMSDKTNNTATIFDFTVENLEDKDKKYKLNLNGSNTTLCTNLKLVSSAGTHDTIYKNTIENIRIYINGINAPITKCETLSNGSKVGTVTYTTKKKNFLATKENVDEVYNSISNLKMDRYSFSEDLLSDDLDNCIYTTSITQTFAVGFDFGEEVTEPEIEFEYCFAEDNTFPITRISYFPMLTSPMFRGGTTNFTLLPDMKTIPNQKHILKAKLTGTGRYCGVYIWGDNISGLTHFRFIKAKYNGRYLKCIQGSTQSFSNNRIMNYGIYCNEQNKYTKYKNKQIILFGDSTTYGENGATKGRGISYHVKRNFPQCSVVNEGHNGATSSDFFQRLKTVVDFRDIIAILGCYGVNDGSVSGSITTSIPQELKQTYLETAITTGFTYNEQSIDTEDKYFSLFADDWYGRMAKSIEYIKFYNPMTQIYLHSYHPSDKWANHQEMFEKFGIAMKELATYYAVPFIDCYHELGMTNANSNNYLMDWAHLKDIGNEIKGNYLANQIENKLLVYPYEDDEYAVKSLTINRETETVSVGSSIYLYVKVAPYNATNKNIIWSIDNEGITIDKSVIGLEWQKIKVTGVTAGTTVATATSEDGDYTATCTITVTE